MNFSYFSLLDFIYIFIYIYLTKYIMYDRIFFTYRKEMIFYMNNSNYQLFLKAKQLIKERDYLRAIRILRNIISLEPYDYISKFELAKLLIKDNQTKEEGREILIELLNTQSKTYAMLELGRLEASEGNNKEARKYFLELLNTPNKTYAMLELGRLEASEGNNKEARKYFQQLLNAQNKTYAMLELGRLEASEGNNKEARKYFLKLLNTPSKNYAMLELLFLAITENNLLEAKKILDKIPLKNLYYSKYMEIKIFLNYKLGLIKESNIEFNDYLVKQIFNYNIDLALEHVKKHLDENNNKRLHTIFDNNVNLRELFYEVQEKISEVNPIRYCFVEKYIVCCNEDISTINGERTRYVQVITLPHSKNIITIYPINVINKQLDNKKQLIKKYDLN